MIYVEELSLEEYKDVLSELHGYILKIALEIKRVCDKNNIKYFILGGTLLGAVRHKGFIPWDDDLDIGMLREDYERFIRICPRELGDDFQIMTFENERKFALPYSKVQMKNTAFIEKNAPMYTCGNGIYVDVGPVDKIPDSEIRKKIFGIRSMFLRYALTKKCGYEDSTPEVTIKKRIGRLYAKLHSKENLISKSNHVVTRYNNKATKQYYVTGSAYRFGKEVIPVESLTGDLPEYPFEGIMLKGPKNPEVILEMLYGDYMALPPEDKRYNRHGTIAVDFHHSAT